MKNTLLMKRTLCLIIAFAMIITNVNFVSLAEGSEGNTSIYDANGYDVNGFNASGYDVNGFDVNGFDVNGYNASGYDVNGFDVNGYNASGFNASGFNASGFDVNGFDANGYDADGYNKDGVDSNGNKKGDNNTTNTYDENGYDKNGFDKNGFDVNGYDVNGYDVNGYDVNGYDVNGFDVDGFDIDGNKKLEAASYNMLGNEHLRLLNDAPVEQATVKFTLQFVNSNDKTVEETFKFEANVDELTTETVASLLAMSEVQAYMTTKNLTNNSENNDKINNITVVAEAKNKYNEANHLGTIKLNKIEYKVKQYDNDNNNYLTTQVVQGKTFTTLTTKQFKNNYSTIASLGNNGTTLMWEITDIATNASYTVKPGTDITVTSDIRVKAIVTHTVTLKRGDGSVLSTQEVEHNFSGKLTINENVDSYQYRNLTGWQAANGLTLNRVGNVQGEITEAITFTAQYKDNINVDLLPNVVVSDYAREFNNTKVNASEVGLKLVALDGTVYTEGVDYNVEYSDEDKNTGFPKIKNNNGANGSQTVNYKVTLITDNSKSAFDGLSIGNLAKYKGSFDVKINPIVFTITIGDLTIEQGTQLSTTSLEQEVQSQIDAALAGKIEEKAYAKDLGDMVLNYTQTLVDTVGDHNNVLGLELLKKGKVTVDNDTYKFNKANYKITFVHGDLIITAPATSSTSDPTPAPAPTTEATAATPVAAPAAAPAAAATEDEQADETEIPSTPVPQSAAPEQETTETQIEDTQTPTSAAQQETQSYLWVWILIIASAAVGATAFGVKAKKQK